MCCHFPGVLLQNFSSPEPTSTPTLLALPTLAATTTPSVLSLCRKQKSAGDASGARHVHPRMELPAQSITMAELFDGKVHSPEPLPAPSIAIGMDFIDLTSDGSMVGGSSGPSSSRSSTRRRKASSLPMDFIDLSSEDSGKYSCCLKLQPEVIDLTYLESDED
ncbi:hypothetical protein PUNSTDRAFT_134324 [Punctularia strigosozonata HHB-11173 SS5]|uniref:uncharacterized protein n=1 Tax=Punctularia strigosozonata (strain HHB-11173) TaxID=741275 RepID=UPI000441671B|nr:uncharacterized protein PUNSTDRAFT_134324 [Punctularia strigosozonata HHB-11173 SS5]EIN09159.1 hypothetical protein PUNSTDRAFT_134324 [Punctularia strigosozonata HHB-11173 SS5]